MVKKKVFLSVLIVAVLSLTSCLDIIQSLTVKGDTIHNDISITLQKSAMEMASSMSEEDKDYSEFFDEDLMKDFTNKAIDSTVDIIDSESEVGYFIHMNFKKTFMEELETIDELYFVPIIDNQSISILFNYKEQDKDKEVSDEDAQMEQMTNAVLGGSKYRLLLSGSEFEVKRAELIGVEGSVEVKKYGDIYIVEMPISVWLMARKDFTLKVYYKPVHYK